MVYRAKGRRLWLRFGFTIFGVSMASSAVPVFSIVYGSVQLSAWAGLCTIWGIITLILLIAVQNDIHYQMNYKVFQVTMFLGIIATLVGFAFFPTYIILGVVNHETGINMHGYYVVVVWTFIFFKWGITLTLYSRWFKQALHESNFGLENMSSDVTRIIEKTKSQSTEISQCS